MDLSEQCGHTIEEQLQLFTNIKPLFVNKPIIAVMNKTDIIRPDELTDENKERLAYFKTEGIWIYLKPWSELTFTNCHRVFDECFNYAGFNVNRIGDPVSNRESIKNS